MQIDFLRLSIISLGDTFLEYPFPIIPKYYFGFKNLVSSTRAAFHELPSYSSFKLILLIVGGFLIVKKLLKETIIL